MTVVVSKGLITRAHQSSAVDLTSQSQVASNQIHQGVEASKSAAAQHVVQQATSDAAINSVRSALKVDRTDNKLRNAKDADSLAENLGERIRSGEDLGGAEAHAGLDPVGASGHLG